MEKIFSIRAYEYQVAGPAEGKHKKKMESVVLPHYQGWESQSTSQFETICSRYKNVAMVILQ